MWFVRFKRTGKRNEIFLATKFGLTVSAEGQFIVRGEKEYVNEAVDRSLRRLGVDTIDLYYAHR
jgi:aryl-alcohol dehydrogenase-like predicted oxidoreductase